ncbi:lipoate-protein ligase B [Rhodoblastus sphagnicola]|uniref:Octanoyltransferase n=1 Tax=Rhodoblastus sphagnicola TaxID=333368 RepID=A0A2S6NG36_9HYPH|nr:lipoyl(octanoyl) transferase LipB [Rhodoblastus sphagnicola]MBB4199511.1 lipoyl(octanoyl) transferase [Rhodoblastus sphagnicola]PPQ33529.1 lipoate-protein ligase B [Rhodoblastus sphagnicola]
MSEPRETLSKNFLPAEGSPPVDWIVSDGLTDYAFALKRMEDWAAAIADGATEKVWLLEHPPLYTAGTSAKPQDLLTKNLPVFEAGRGGQYTYHGPGQRVAYVLLDLSRRRRDVRAFVGALESWLIAALAQFNVQGETREDRVGVWTRRPDKPAGPNGEPAEDKIAAIGVRLRRWVSFHGVSLNVEPDLGAFAGIVPCGIGARHLGVTSLVDLGLPVTLTDVDIALRQAFQPIFGATRAASAIF